MPDRQGFVWHGDILTGKVSVEEAFAIQARRLAARLTTAPVADPENYDPVLKFHLGIK